VSDRPHQTRIFTRIAFFAQKRWNLLVVIIFMGLLGLGGRSAAAGSKCVEEVLRLNGRGQATVPTAKIFVYPLPPRFNEDILNTNPACNTSMFSAEIRIHEWLKNCPHARTEDPENADYFFLPVYSTCYLTKNREAVAKLHVDPHRYQRQIVAQALSWILERDEYRPYLTRKAAADHLLAATHDFGKCFTYRDMGHGTVIGDGLHEHASLLHEMVYLQYNGEHSTKSSCFVPGHDVVIPPVSAYESAPDYRRAKAANNNGGDAENKQDGSGDKAGKGADPPRLPPPTVYFRGKSSWMWFGSDDPGYSHGVRQALHRMYAGDSLINVRSPPADSSPRHLSSSSSSSSSSSGYPLAVRVRVSNEKASLQDYTREMQEATFCLAPLGYATWTQRFADSVQFGCIPVLIGDHTEWPFSRFMQYSTFAILISESEARKPGKIPEILGNISRNEASAKLKALHEIISPLFRYSHAQVETEASASTNSVTKRRTGHDSSEATQCWPKPLLRAFAAGQSGGCGACEMIHWELSARLIATNKAHTSASS